MALHGQADTRSLLVLPTRPSPSAARAVAYGRLRGLLAAPSVRDGAVPAVVATGLAAAGAFTLSWERFGNIAVGPYNLKLPVVLFALSALLGFPDLARRTLTVLRMRTAVSLVVALAAAIVVLFVVRGLFVDPFSAGLGQIASLLSGAVLPAFVALGVARTRADLLWLLVWVVRGAYFAGAFGLWQLFAFYTGLPQGVVYTGVGTSGVGGRIAAFSYEPAYFAYFLVLAVCAALAVARFAERPLPWRTVAFFSVVLALANVRALMFLLPLVGLLLAFDWRRNRCTLVRAVAVGIPVALLAGFAPVVVQSAVDAVTRTSAAPTQVAAGDGPQQLDGSRASADGRERMQHPPVAKERPRHHRTKVQPPAVVAPPVAVPAVAAPSAVLDPSEQTSNAPRLALYRATLGVALQHPLLGVGPGGLRKALGQGTDTHGGQVVANNMWLQAAADGGVPLLLLEFAVVVLLGLLWLRNRASLAQPLAAGLLGVVAVGGMLTSYFFDVKLWVIGAAVLAAYVLEAPESRLLEDGRSAAI